MLENSISSLLSLMRFVVLCMRRKISFDDCFRKEKRLGMESGELGGKSESHAIEKMQRKFLFVHFMTRFNKRK